MLTYMKDCHLDTIALILKEGIEHERRLKTAGKWNPTKKQGSIFATKEVKQDEVNQEQKGGGKQSGTKPTHDRSGNPINRHPPKTNEPHERQNKLTKCSEYWCGNPKCSRWGNHLTNDHTAWFEKLRDNRKAHKNNKKGKETVKEDNKVEESIGGALKVPRGNFVEQCSNSNF